MISEGYKSAYQQGYSDAMRDFRKKSKTDVLDKPVGKWIIEDGDDEYYGPWYKCPKCDRSVAGCDADKFCPHCGARLEEEDANN